MKKLLFIIISALALLAFSETASAYGIDPVQDSIAVERFRVKMDSIRQHRPVVGLVLSGGGAKGVAHVGVIRRLEELGIPVDMVVGTSMGGLIGGMLSLGYNSDEMERTVASADWDYLISDKMPRETKSLAEVKYRAQHHIIIPFWYEKGQFISMKEEAYEMEGETKQYAALKIGAEDESSFVMDNLWESLPESLVKGQNVTNYINGFTVGYSDTLDFTTLPIPYCSVASDMVSLKAKYWYEGKMGQALRSTMAIPILFTSVRTEGMVLVDGGMRENYPVETAKRLGADIIIGVELSQAVVTYSDVNNLMDILSQGVDMLGSDSFYRNKDAADVKIKPDLHEYNMLSFSDENIPIILQRGYDAACQQDSALLAIKQRLGDDTISFQAKKAVNIGEEYVRINEIEITGVSAGEEEWLMNYISVVPGGLVNREKMERVVADISATQTFETVTYEFLGTKEPYKLVLHFTKGPIHQLGLGLRFDSEEVVAANFNLGLFTRRLQGHRFNLDAKVCVNPSLSLMYSYDHPSTPTFNAQVKAGYSDLSLFKFGSRTTELNQHRLNTDIWKIKADVFVSNIKLKHVDLKGGLRYDFFGAGVQDVANYNQMYDMNQTTGNYLTLYSDASIETFDSYYYPNKGYSLRLYYGWTFAGWGKWSGSDTFYNFHSVQFDGKFIVPADDIFTFIPSFYVRYLGSRQNYLNRNDPTALPTIPFPFMNLMGGNLPGRYLDQQIPFIGLNFSTCTDNILLLGRTDFRFKVADNCYLTGMVNYARSCHLFSTFGQGTNYVGAGVEFAYNTAVGPLAVDLHWGGTDKDKDELGFHAITKMPGFCISFGYTF